MKTTKHKKWNIEKNRRKWIHKVKFFTIQVNQSGKNGGQSSLFSDDLWKVNFTGDYPNNKLFKLKSIEVMTNIQETYQLRVIIMN